MSDFPESPSSPQRRHPDRLLKAVVNELPEPAWSAAMPEAAWIDVIRKMDEVYSDLIRYEIDLEGKNAALEQAQQFIASVLASMSDILVVCDHRGRIQQVNAALLKLTGFAVERLQGQSLALLMADEDARLFRPGGLVAEHEARLRAADGSWTDLVAMNCSPRHPVEGAASGMLLPGLVIVGRPVGELRRAYEELHIAHLDLKTAQQQLIQAEKMASLGRLVAGVAHELNNPISFVLGNVHMLDRYRGRLERYLAAVHAGIDPAGREALRRELKLDALLADLGPLIDGTVEGAQRVSEIVKNLRRLSFANPVERRSFNFSEVARNALNWVLKAAKRPVLLEDCLPDGLAVLGLEGPLHQVMVNLAQNAIDAMEEVAQPCLSVSGGRLDDRVVVVVRDNGPGLGGEVLSKVFDPFFTTKPVGKGTGLGLWVTWSIVRDHGGAIEAANAPNGGAAFTLILPAG